MQDKNRDKSILKQRILQYLDFKGIKSAQVYRDTGIANGVFSQNNGLSEDNILRFISFYADVNPSWLLTGEGEMLKGMVVSKQDNASIIAYLKETIAEKDKRIEELNKEIGALKKEVKPLEISSKNSKGNARRRSANSA